MKRAKGEEVQSEETQTSTPQKMPPTSATTPTPAFGPAPATAGVSAGTAASATPPVIHTGSVTASAALTSEATEQKQPDWPHTADGQPAQLHKIEYYPFIRDVETCGGVDLGLVDRTLEPVSSGRGRRPRSLHELGTVDIADLVLSLRSRMHIEVAYALSMLQILSKDALGAGGAGGLLLRPCEDLLDEMLSLLQDLVFGTASPGSSGENRFNSYGSEPVLDSESPQLGPTARIVNETQAELPPTPPLEHQAGIPCLSDHVQDRPAKLKSHLTLVREAKAAELETRPFRRLCVSSNSSIENTVEDQDPKMLWSLLHGQRQAEQNATTALTVLNVLRNCAQLSQNVAFFNAQPRLWPLLIRLAQVVVYFAPPSFIGARQEEHPGSEENDEGDRETGERFGALPGLLKGGRETKPFCDLAAEGTSIPFTYGEAVRVRKDVLVIATCLAGEYTDLPSLSKKTIQGIWDLFSSFLFDFEAEREVEGRMTVGLQPGVRGPYKIPYYANVALQGLAQLTLPDPNRSVLAKIIPPSSLFHLGNTLLHQLPLELEDFQHLSTEARVAHVERVALLLFNLVWLSPSLVKRRWLTGPGNRVVLLHAVHRLSLQGADFQRNPYRVLAARLCAVLKLLCDGNDLLDDAQESDENGSLHLPLPFPGPQAGTKRTATTPPPLIDHLPLVLEILAVPNLDAEMAEELQSVIV